MNDQLVNLESLPDGSRRPSLLPHVFAALTFAVSLLFGWILPSLSLGNVIVVLRIIGIIHPTARYNSDWLLVLSVNNGLWIVVALLLWIFIGKRLNKTVRWGLLGFLSGAILATFPLCTTLVLHCIDAIR